MARDEAAATQYRLGLGGGGGGLICNANSLCAQSEADDVPHFDGYGGGDGNSGDGANCTGTGTGDARKSGVSEDGVEKPC